jgi:cyanate permease
MSGAAFGPMLAGFIYDVTDTYRLAFTIFAVLSILAMVTIYFARPPGPEAPN